MHQFSQEFEMRQLGDTLWHTVRQRALDGAEEEEEEVEQNKMNVLWVSELNDNYQGDNLETP